MERKSFEQTLEDIGQPNDEQLYLDAFNWNKARYPQEHADVMDKYFAQIEEGNTKYSQWVLDSWVFNLITASGKRIDDERS